MPTQPIGGTSGSSEANAVGQMINHSDRGVGSSGNGTANIQQHHYHYQQQEPADNSAQTMVIKHEANVSNFFTKNL
jgi:hypothetical protein